MIILTIILLSGSTRLKSRSSFPWWMPGLVPVHGVWYDETPYFLRGLTQQHPLGFFVFHYRNKISPLAAVVKGGSSLWGLLTEMLVLWE